MVIGIRTLVSSDGVIGLNGYFYLEDEEGNQLIWSSLEKAKQYSQNFSIENLTQSWINNYLII